MRNLKRALSLALASVMLLGMMVVGTSASYPDVKADDNKEAIEVMQLLKVMTGDDKGNFNPAKAVTRNEMAVIMCKLLPKKIEGGFPYEKPETGSVSGSGFCHAAGHDGRRYQRELC